MKKVLALAVLSLAMAACETPTAQRYSISADNNSAIKALSVTSVGFRSFTGPEKFNATCRALGPIKVADGLSHTQYIQKAFEDEFKIAGAHAQDRVPQTTLGGVVTKLDFSSSQGLTRGFWDIDLTLESSNGRTLSVSEHYEFDTGFIANEACRNTAEAFTRAVQNLVGKAVRTPDFKGLLLPSAS
ncbi:MAG: hypothetical protein M3Z20_06745 [Chloroflexota bacterium]|nr:hypothetical protein [Chloroflexota bacterium]